MKPASVALHVTTGIIVGLFASHFHWALGLAVTISYFIVLGECLYSEANATFTRFDDAPSLSVMSRGALTIETLRIGNIFAKIIKSHYVPTKNAPVVIMHHGYGSNYRRMLVYAYPVALAGYAMVSGFDSVETAAFAVFSENMINVGGQYMLTNDLIGYVVFDVEKEYTEFGARHFNKIEGTIRTRVIS